MLPSWFSSFLYDWLRISFVSGMLGRLGIHSMTKSTKKDPEGLFNQKIFKNMYFIFKKFLMVVYFFMEWIIIRESI